MGKDPKKSVTENFLCAMETLSSSTNNFVYNYFREKLKSILFLSYVLLAED